MLKYLTKISMDILPSVLATIIGAYIVNHYVNVRPAEAPAAAVAAGDVKKGATPAEGGTKFANLPGPGIKAKGISEKSIMDKPGTESALDASGKTPESKPAESGAAETAAVPHPRHSPVREKSTAKAVAPPAVSAPAVSPAAETNASVATPDANDLARAAIDRLRKTHQAAPQETARVAEPARVHEAPRIGTVTPPVLPQPLPPPITVSTPASEAYNGWSPAANAPYTASVRTDDPLRPTPPADIPSPPVSPPFDLRADVGGSVTPPRTNVADEMLSAAKSMFHAVLPKSGTPD